MSPFVAVVAYALIATLAFAVSIHVNSDLIARGLNDDAVGTAFAILSLFILSLAWPITAVVFAAAGIFVAIAKAVVASDGRRPMKRRTMAELHARAAAEMQANPPISYTVVDGQVRYANTADAIRAAMNRLNRAIIGIAEAFELMRDASGMRPW